MASEPERDELKAVLDAARMEIGVAMKRIDTADEKELLAIAGAAHQLGAFVDFNTGCGSLREDLRGQLAAFVDFNTSCSGAPDRAGMADAAFVDFNGSCGSLNRTNEVIRRLSTGGAK